MHFSPLSTESLSHERHHTICNKICGLMGANGGTRLAQPSRVVLRAVNVPLKERGDLNLSPSNHGVS